MHYAEFVYLLREYTTKRLTCSPRDALPVNAAKNSTDAFHQAVALTAFEVCVLRQVPLARCTELNEILMRCVEALTGVHRSEMSKLISSSAVGASSPSPAVSMFTTWSEVTERPFFGDGGEHWLTATHRFLWKDYHEVIDGVADVQGLRMATLISEGRAAWWKPKRSDMVACAETMQTGGAGSDLATRLAADNEAGACGCYYLPFRVARVGCYRDHGEYQDEVRALRERVREHIRVGEELSRRLARGAEATLRMVAQRLPMNGDSKMASHTREIELYACCLHSVMGCACIREPAISGVAARKIRDVTGSAEFAALVQTLQMMSTRWIRTGEADHPVTRALRSVREHFALRGVSLSLSTDGAKDSPTPSSERRGCRSTALRMLENHLTATEAQTISAFVTDAADGAATVSMPSPRAPAENERRWTFEEQLMREMARHRIRDTAAGNVMMHGLYDEKTFSPLMALPARAYTMDARNRDASEPESEGRTGSATTDSVTQLRRELAGGTEWLIPCGMDRLCRRRYRPIPIPCDGSAFAEAFFGRGAPKSAEEAARRASLVFRLRAPVASETLSTRVGLLVPELRLPAPLRLMRSLRRYLDLRGRWLDVPRHLSSERARTRGSRGEREASEELRECDDDIHPFLIFPDEFRVSFNVRELSRSNCIDIRRGLHENSSDVTYARFRLDAVSTVGDVTTENALEECAAPYRHARSACGRFLHVYTRSEQSPFFLRSLEACAALKGRLIETSRVAGTTDARLNEFCPGAVLDISELGAFAYHCFGELIFALSRDPDPRAPWHALTNPRNLPSISTARRAALCAADPDVRRFYMWVTVELQRLLLLLNSQELRARVIGAGLTFAVPKATRHTNVDSDEEGEGFSSSSLSSSPYEYLTTLSTSSDAAASDDGKRQIGGRDEQRAAFEVYRANGCRSHAGYMKAPGYHAIRHPYVARAFVDGRGECLGSAPLWFASILMRKDEKNVLTEEMLGKIGYDRIDFAADADSRSFRLMNTCDYLRAGVSFCTSGGRRCFASLPSSSGAEIKSERPPSIGGIGGGGGGVGESATPAEKMAALVAKVSLRDECFMSRVAEDRYSVQACGVPDAQMSQSRAAQRGTRFVFTDVVENGRCHPRVCLGDAHRRECLGFGRMREHDEFMLDASVATADSRRGARPRIVLFPNVSATIPSTGDVARDELPTRLILSSSSSDPICDATVDADVAEEEGFKRKVSESPKEPKVTYARAVDALGVEGHSLKIRNRVDIDANEEKTAVVPEAVSLAAARWRSAAFSEDGNVSERALCAELLLRYQTDCARTIAENLRLLGLDLMAIRDIRNAEILRELSALEEQTRALVDEIRSLSSRDDRDHDDSHALRVFAEWLHRETTAFRDTRSRREWCFGNHSAIRAWIGVALNATVAWLLLRTSPDDTLRTRTICAIARKLDEYPDHIEELAAKTITDEEMEVLRTWCRCERVCNIRFDAYNTDPECFYNTSITKTPLADHTTTANRVYGDATKRCTRQDIRTIAARCAGTSASYFTRRRSEKSSSLRIVWLNVCIRRVPRSATTESDDIQGAAASLPDADDDTMMMDHFSRDWYRNEVYYRIVYESLIDEISRPGDKRPRCAAQEQFGGRFALGMVASVAFSVENAGIATTWSDANAVRLLAGGMWRCSFDATVTKENHDVLAAQLLSPTPTPTSTPTANEIDSDRTPQSAPRVFALLTLRYADGHPLSTKKKPFRFWLDPAVISHATAEARRANSDDLRLPIIFRGQLLTNEKRRVSIKDGGACAIRCSRAGRVEGVRVSLAVDELERDVHVDDL
ncbi:hypothetical protein CYMTET_49160 [Cymbomonas tetramitiformis]|uniref:Uncharacterized protein n=1 Tax=Cymbomonas tetramitiformis TaxID=36881 RepID=A0AAE0BSH2_9CHLO|nr:hypothetical protein CYMTET_49160 [Cymbomonas tetramitiformis]